MVDGDLPWYKVTKETNPKKNNRLQEFQCRETSKSNSKSSVIFATQKGFCRTTEFQCRKGRMKYPGGKWVNNTFFRNWYFLGPTWYSICFLEFMWKMSAIWTFALRQMMTNYRLQVIDLYILYCFFLSQDSLLTNPPTHPKNKELRHVSTLPEAEKKSSWKHLLYWKTTWLRT